MVVEIVKMVDAKIYEAAEHVLRHYEVERERIEELAVMLQLLCDGFERRVHRSGVGHRSTIGPFRYRRIGDERCERASD